MRRFTARLQPFTFESLLCGAHDALPPPIHIATACARAKEEFASKCSTAAPLPATLTAAIVANHLLNKNLRAAAARLASHPSQRQVVDGVCDYVAQYPDEFAVSTLMGMSEEAQCVSADATASFLRVAVQRLVSNSDREAGNASACGTQRENLRSCIVRHIRFHPLCASSLLGSLCAVSDGSPRQCDDVMDAMQIAMRERSMNPQDFGCVLDVVWKSGDRRRVASMWGWMRHTSACWDVRAASVAMMAFSELWQMDEAVACLQKLAEADRDPAIGAQVAFLRSLGAHKPSLFQYAVRLVLHWHPSSEQLWRGEPQVVAMELMKVCCASGELTVAVEMLEQMVKVNMEVPVELESFMLLPDAAILGAQLSLFVAESKALQTLFIDVPMRLSSLGERPELMGLLLSLGLASSRLAEVYDALEKTTVTPEHFQSALDLFTKGGAVKVAGPAAVLACVREAGVRTGNTVPKEMDSWLQLSMEMSPQRDG